MQPDDPTQEEIEESCRLIREVGFRQRDGHEQQPWTPNVHAKRMGHAPPERLGTPRTDLPRMPIPFAHNFSDMSHEWRADCLGEPYELGE